MNIALTAVMVLAFLGGLYLASALFQSKEPPLSAVNIHGMVGLSVLVLLGFKAFSMTSIQLWIAFGALIMASMGGLYLVGNHKKGNPGPTSAIIIHGIFGLTGIVVTLLSIW